MANLRYEDLVRNGYRWTCIGLISTKSSRVLKPKTDRHGYLFYGVIIDGKRRYMSQHRIVYEAVHGKIPEGLQINHKNSIRDDNRIENLEVVTPGENQKHGYEFGNRDSSGEKNGMSKLTEQQVREIYGLRKQGWALKKIAAQFEISWYHVGNILRGKKWNHIFTELYPNSP